MSDLAQALMVAIRVHAGQVDKQGEPYLLHVLRVVEAVSYEAKVVAALHDVLEDGDLNLEELEGEADLDPDEVEAIAYLTRRPDENYTSYIEQIARAYEPGEVPRLPSEAQQIAREVKLADLRDNLGRIPTTENCVPCGGKGSFWGDRRPCVECAGTGRKPAGAKWASLKARYEKALASLEAGGKT